MNALSIYRERLDLALENKKKEYYYGFVILARLRDATRVSIKLFWSTYILFLFDKN